MLTAKDGNRIRLSHGLLSLRDDFWALRPLLRIYQEGHSDDWLDEAWTELEKNLDDLINRVA